ncbi:MULTISPECIES: cupin domain-containing protein [Undibacterium]|jgi:mannose-6-phosphate isomerase-like protein (cupin superfamily)|uniref:Cupin domain-containing protein n=1 Tax=Undibacterium umbellatum TaxID=2762300 RepID=A0ABR6Z412_9BURK|nr:MULTISPECIES: cupin domain-containing protein [Undibacterium]MBC3906531.1 cupin domain-containing protein [Undibacterium umbellatum]MDP1980403.1 cupin domain-containing protein [Undibacterium sp.]
MKIESQKTYVALAADGMATVLAGGPAFWSLPESEIDAFGKHWLISEFSCDADWPNWEMHPHADEFVYLLSGLADFHIELDDVVQNIQVKAGEAVLVPKGRWHTAKVFAPCRMLFMTRGEGTQHKLVIKE